MPANCSKAPHYKIPTPHPPQKKPSNKDGVLPCMQTDTTKLVATFSNFNCTAKTRRL